MIHLLIHAENVREPVSRKCVRAFLHVRLIGICFVLLGIVRAVPDERAVPKDEKTEAIRIASQYETIFTMRAIEVRGKQAGVVDQIIKGNIDATKLAFAQTFFVGEPGPKRIIVFMKFDHQVIDISTIDALGRVAVAMDRKNKREISAKLDDLIFELDESPSGIAARHKRDASNKPEKMR